MEDIKSCNVLELRQLCSRNEVLQLVMDFEEEEWATGGSAACWPASQTAEEN